MEHNNAGFFRRLIAQLIDLKIILLVALVPMYFFSTNLATNFRIDPISPLVNITTYILLLIFLGSIINIFYTIYFTSKFGGTIGKLLCGLKIVDNDNDNLLDNKTAFYRIFAGYTFSASFFWVGYFKIITSPENRGWHDRLFNTKVIKTSSFIPGILSYVFLFVITLVLLYMIGDSLATLPL